MNKRNFTIAFIILTMTYALWASPTQDGAKKLCWCHVVRWGFFQKTYDSAGAVQDLANVATDRTLLGNLTQERAAFWANPKIMIRTAMQYGIDGFCVDMVDPKSYIGLGDFLQAAEGTDFKIALAMDNQPHRNADYCIQHIGNYLRKYYNHPNHAHIDGKPVIFVYSCGMPLEEWSKVVSGLKEQGLEAYFLHRATFEWMMADNFADQEAVLKVSNGLYDFGCNGFTQDQMSRRIANMVISVEKANSDALLVAGVAPGYLGREVGNYRPYMNSQSLAWNWQAVFDNPRVNWVCVSTWNDYTETTHIEPSVVNRDSLARLNHEYIRLWKGEKAPSRPAQAILSYHEEVTCGHDLTFEVASFPYDLGDYRVTLRICNERGNVPLKEFKDIRLPKDSIGLQTFRLTHDEMQDAMMLRVFASLQNDNDDQTGCMSQDELQEFYPVVRRVEHVESQRTIRIPFDELSVLKIALSEESDKLAARFSAWEFGGKVELLRNGYPVCEEELQHTGSPVKRLDFDFPEYGRSSQDVYVVRFTDVSGNIKYSNPVMKRRGDTTTVIEQPVIVTGTDFEEDWPLWNGGRPAARMGKMNVTEDSIYKLCYEMTEGDGKIARSSTEWKLPLALGTPGRGFVVRGADQILPVWIEAEGPKGEMRKCLKFFGTSVATLPVRSMPIGVFTIEAYVKPEKFDKPVFLFGEQKPFSVMLLPDGTLELAYATEYRNAKLQSTIPVDFDAWSHVAIVCAGDKEQIFINGRLAGEQQIIVQTMPINSLPSLGNQARTRAEGFRGLVAGYAIAGTVLTPATFQLEKWR